VGFRKNATEVNIILSSNRANNCGIIILTYRRGALTLGRKGQQRPRKTSLSEGRLEFYFVKLDIYSWKKMVEDVFRRKATCVISYSKS
jgi:hypothetical protein